MTSSESLNPAVIIITFTPESPSCVNQGYLFYPKRAKIGFTAFIIKRFLTNTFVEKDNCQITKEKATIGGRKCKSKLEKEVEKLHLSKGFGSIL